MSRNAFHALDREWSERESRLEEIRAMRETIRCNHNHVIRGNDYGRDLGWCDDCGEITFCSDSDWPEPSYRKYSARVDWFKNRVIAFGCINEAGHEKFGIPPGGKRCEIWCNHNYCPHTLRARIEKAEP